MRRPRLIWAALAVVATLALPAGANAATVKVIDTDGSLWSFNPANFEGEEDVLDAAYTIRPGDSTVQVDAGFSLDQVIRLAGPPDEPAKGPDAISYGYLTIPRPSGGTVTLTNGQVRKSESPDGPPVVYAEGSSLGFIRPSLGEGDENAPDSFAAAGELVVTLHTGSPIRVHATASDSKIKAGGKVQFSASVIAPDGLSPAVSWSFGDGGTAAGTRVSHTFKREGTYHVAVSATTPEDPAGASDVVIVTVGEPKKRGPDRSGGGKDKGDGAGDSGSSEDTGGSSGGTGTAPGGTPGPGVPVAPGTTAPPIPGPEPRDDGRDKPDRAPEPGEQVSGELLEDAGAAPEQTDPVAEQPLPTLRTGTERADGLGLSGAAMGGMTVVALFALGALGQAGKIRLDSILWHANRLVGR